MTSLTCLCVMTWEDTSARFSCVPLYFPSLPLSFSITPFPQEQTWDWLCIGVSPASICLTPGPAFLHPHEREQQIKKRGRMEKGVRERKREVCLCPKGLVSVCLNQEVRMWRQEKQSRDIHSVCVGVCFHEPCWAEVSYMWRSQLHASGNQGWCSKSLKCQRQLCSDTLRGCACVCVNAFECLLGHLMEIDTSFSVWKWKCYQVCHLGEKRVWHCII